LPYGTSSRIVKEGVGTKVQAVKVVKVDEKCEIA